MIPTNNEKFTLTVYKRIKNSAYQWEDTPSIRFKGRVASQIEVKEYRIQKGVNGGSDSTFVYATNLPYDVEINDKIKFMGKEWEVKSVGYYFDAALFVNPGVLTEEQIAKRCPKGINIQ